jgi:hypothetical protein
MKQILNSLVVGLIAFSSFTAQAITWQSVFIAGDDSIANFDNGREDLAKILESRGTMEQHHYSSSPELARGPVTLATLQNIGMGIGTMNVKGNEGCFVHMTSHGIKHGGFYLSQSERSPLLPRTFTTMINQTCADQPTVILISACYSGQFIIDELKGDNRIIMTAAIADRPSFGCSADTEYTYWDHCLIDEVPKSQTWSDVYANVKACVQRKEKQIGATPSLPQAFFGKNTSTWKILE